MNESVAFTITTTARSPRPRLSLAAAHVHHVAVLHEEFPNVPLHILNRIFEAFVHVTATTSDALVATRARVHDALALEPAAPARVGRLSA